MALGAATAEVDFDWDEVAVVAVVLAELAVVLEVLPAVVRMVAVPVNSVLGVRSGGKLG